MQDPIRDAGTFESPRARQYMQQLCKHFAHKVEATCSEERAEISFPFGTAHFDATDSMFDVRIEADSDDGLLKARQVIDNHLSRFAFREDVKTITWQSAS